MFRPADAPDFTAVENYFNYFTEIEECFRKCRGTPSLLSTLDWALIEAWKESSIPLEAALLGIRRSFEKFSTRPRPGRKVNSLAYCAPAVLEAAEEIAGVRDKEGNSPASKAGSPPFSVEEVLGYLERNAKALENASRLARQDGQPILAEDLMASAGTLRGNAAPKDGAALADLEELERKLTALEEILTASLARAASVELLAQFRREVERGIIPYRGKMTGAQIESLERQFLKKRLFEHYQVPRLSLFYL